MSAISTEVANNQITSLTTNVLEPNCDIRYSPITSKADNRQRKCLPQEPAQSPVENEDVNFVRKIPRGNPLLEERFIRKYRPKLNLMLLRLTRDPSRAEDLTHDALILVLQRLRTDGINEPEKLSAYTYSTAKFIYFGWLRKMDNQVELRDCMDDFVGVVPEPEQDNILREDRNYLQRLVDNLPVERDREILSRRYLQDQSKSDICDDLFLSGENYDRVISRARNRLIESGSQDQ